jgi:hypothetical protein
MGFFHILKILVAFLWLIEIIYFNALDELILEPPKPIKISTAIFVILTAAIHPSISLLSWPSKS